MVKIGGFQFSKILSEKNPSLSTLCGTPEYAGLSWPEKIQNYCCGFWKHLKSCEGKNTASLLTCGLLEFVYIVCMFIRTLSVLLSMHNPWYCFFPFNFTAKSWKMFRNVSLVLQRSIADLDWHSCLLVLIQRLCGFPPFSGDELFKLYRSIKRCDYNFPSPHWDDISESAKNLVRKLLVADPKERLTAHQVLRHKWMRENWKDLQVL